MNEIKWEKNEGNCIKDESEQDLTNKNNLRENECYMLCCARFLPVCQSVGLYVPCVVYLFFYYFPK